MTEEELIESSEEEKIEEWQELKEHPDYEINVNYPHQIRKKSNGRILKEHTLNEDYVQVALNRKQYLKHRLIAFQFIPNPNNLSYVDHINHIRNDNRIQNLRWVSHLQNMNNISKTWINREIDFVQELPDEVIVINQYHQYHFEGYYFCNDVFYKDTGNGDYRIVPWRYDKSTKTFKVSLTDINTITRTISKRKFYHIYGLD